MGLVDSEKGVSYSTVCVRDLRMVSSIALSHKQGEKSEKLDRWVGKSVEIFSQEVRGRRGEKCVIDRSIGWAALYKVKGYAGKNALKTMRVGRLVNVCKCD